VFLATIALLAGLTLADPPSASDGAAPTVTSLELGPSEEEEAARLTLKKKGAGTLRVGYVRVEGRWAGKVHLPLEPGEPLTPESLSRAMNALRSAIDADAIDGYGLRSAGAVGILRIDVRFEEPPGDRSPSRQLGVIFRPFYLGFSLHDIGGNVLPIPRSPFPTLHDQVPGLLLALRPNLAFTRDQAFGTAAGLALSVDVLNLFDPARIDATPGNEPQLDLALLGLKALDERFYRTGTDLHLGWRRSAGLLRALDFAGRLALDRVPLALAEHAHLAGGGSASLMLRLHSTTRLALDAGYRRGRDRVVSAGQATRETFSNDLTSRALLESLPPRLFGFLRLALWQEHSWLDEGGSYQRLAARAGYAKDLRLCPNVALGVELLAGAGVGSGTLPDHARVFGGAPVGQFLYDGRLAASLLSIPAGPIVRSFGEAQAGLIAADGNLRGGTGYWHLNLTVAVPIPPWSRPLIPNEDTDVTDAQGKAITIKEMLRRQVDITGPSMLAAVLEKEGRSPAEATEEANSILGEVRPAVSYVVYDANVWSLKPLLMLDVAKVWAGDLPGQTWTAAGAGLQLTVVVAKLEGGYMRTLGGPTLGTHGNAFVRLVFQNLF
jgi:hypothetical protein